MAEDALMQLVSFVVGKELFALPIMKIQEIIRLTNIVAIPKSPEFVEGVINLRGKVIPVVDLKKKFDMSSQTDESQARIVVAEVKGLIVGMIVDSVSEVMRAQSSDFQETPSLVSNVNQEFVEGIVKQEDRLLIVLDSDKLLSTTEADVLKKVK